ncbi:hypothetical protein DVH24_007498 [Malus domestica]|uniref:Uncharacterized protein n=1 Tax=Malus domestica TaxID=3750 RepID=A0A498HK13_MALDO|nr:hypothetical protein DVH24_007498 [Malus domestica]
MKLVDEEPYEINVDIYGIRDGLRLGRLRLQNKVSFSSSLRAGLVLLCFEKKLLAGWLWRRKIRIYDGALAMNYQLCLSLSSYELKTKLCVDMENEARNYYTNGGKKKFECGVSLSGGPAVGDIRSRCLRLADKSTFEAVAVHRLLGHRLPLDSRLAKSEWYDIVEGEHSLWMGVSKFETIQGNHSSFYGLFSESSELSGESA